MPAPIYMPQKEDMVSQMLMQMFMQKYQHGLQSKTALALQAQKKAQLDEQRLYKEGNWKQQQEYTARAKLKEEKRKNSLKTIGEMFKMDADLKTQEARSPGATSVSKEKFMSDDPKTGIPAFTADKKSKKDRVARVTLEDGTIGVLNLDDMTIRRSTEKAREGVGGIFGWLNKGGGIGGQPVADSGWKGPGSYSDEKGQPKYIGTEAEFLSWMAR